MRIGTRRSALALAQANLLAGLLGDCEIVPIATSGDRGAPDEDKSRWVAELEEALLDGRIDLAVHSAKDVPGELAAGLSLLGAPARASAGDLVICRQNDHGLEAGEAGRTLANGDTLRIEAIRDDGTVMVRRALDCDPGTGARRWTDCAFAYAGYGTADLAYAVTAHSAQGRTVRAGIPVVTGTEERQWHGRRPRRRR